jgi:hypothetical protein
MASSFTLAQLAERKCSRAWACCVRFREVASDHRQVSATRRKRLWRKIKLAAKRGYEELKIHPVTLLSTDRRATLMRFNVEHLPLEERRYALRKEACEDAKREEVKKLLSHYSEASKRLRRRVEAKLLVMLQTPNVVVTVWNAALQTSQELPYAVLLDLPSKPANASQNTTRAVLYDHESSKITGETIPARAGETSPNAPVLDIEKNTITYRDVTWPVLGITLPNVFAAKVASSAEEWARKSEGRLYDWGLRTCRVVSDKQRIIGKGAFAAMAQRHFRGKHITDDQVEAVWPEIRAALGWAGTRIPKSQAIDETELGELLEKAGLLAPRQAKNL